MITIENVIKAYGGDVLFDNASVTIHSGEKCGLVGRNGSGKTTILKFITGEEETDSGSVTTPRHYRCGYLEQHIHFSEPTVLEEASLALRTEDKDKIYKAEKILSGLGFKDSEMLSSPSILSGGYHLRLHLAKVLISEPDCLLLDEPTNYLDIVSIRWFERFLRSWSGEFIIISHDRDFMDAVTTHTIGVSNKHLKKIRGGTEKLFTQMLHEEEVLISTRKNVGKKRADLEAFVQKFGAKATKASQAQSRVKALGRLPALEMLAKIYDLKFSFNHAPLPGKMMLDITSATFSYDKSPDVEPIISDFTLSVGKHDRIAIIGKNGRGKSTILKLIAKELSPQHGQIKHSDNARIGYFGQTHIDLLDPSMTVEDEIYVANPTLTTGEVRSICGLMMFSGNKAKKPVGVLSGGEKSRVLLGKIIAKPCNLLLLDEPSNHLDMESVEALIEAIEAFPTAVVIVTHSEAVLRRIKPSRLIICHQNDQHTFYGDYDTFLSNEGWEEKPPQAKDAAPQIRQQSKRQRAEMVQKRSRELNSLKKRIDTIEDTIMDLEGEIEKHNDELIEASRNGNSPRITSLSKTIAEKTSLSDTEHKKFEELSYQYATRYNHYESQLNQQ